jgi:hypothetical protein
MSFLTDVTHLRDSDNQEWRPDDRSTDSTRAMTAAFNSNSPVAEVARSALQPHPSVDLTNRICPDRTS